MSDGIAVPWDDETLKETPLEAALNQVNYYEVQLPAGTRKMTPKEAKSALADAKILYHRFKENPDWGEIVPPYLEAEDLEAEELEAEELRYFANSLKWAHLQTKSQFIWSVPEPWKQYHIVWKIAGFEA